MNMHICISTHSLMWPLQYTIWLWGCLYVPMHIVYVISCHGIVRCLYILWTYLYCNIMTVCNVCVSCRYTMGMCVCAIKQRHTYAGTLIDPVRFTSTAENSLCHSAASIFAGRCCSNFSYAVLTTATVTVSERADPDGRTQARASRTSAALFEKEGKLKRRAVCEDWDEKIWRYHLQSVLFCY